MFRTFHKEQVVHNEVLILSLVIRSNIYKHLSTLFQIECISAYIRSVSALMILQPALQREWLCEIDLSIDIVCRFIPEIFMQGKFVI